MIKLGGSQQQNNNNNNNFGRPPPRTRERAPGCGQLTWPTAAAME